MAQPTIIEDILLELKRAKKLHPSWPVHIVARAAVVSEEAGELVRAALNYKYESADDNLSAWAKEMRKEAIQTAATCIRFIEALDKDLLQPKQKEEAQTEIPSDASNQ